MNINKVEQALLHALFIHLHHNIDQAVDFGVFKDLNQKVSQTFPGALLVGPDANDDAAVFNVAGEGNLVAKMESHCSPCVPRPYDGAATGAGGAMRDVVAMGARPQFLLDFIGTRPLDQKVVIGPCGFQGECTCGKCETTTSQERVNRLVKGIKDMCEVMDVFVVGGGLSTSFSDIVPAVVVTVIGKMVTDDPLTKPAKEPGHQLIVIGQTGDDGNDTLYRAGLVPELKPARALFMEEKTTMEASLAALKTGKIQACSDMGAAGVGAAVSESARFGGLGARVDLSRVPVKSDRLTPEEILICETQARMMLHVLPEDVETVLGVARAHGADASVVGEITDEDKCVFVYGDQLVATIPNQPDPQLLEKLREE